MFIQGFEWNMFGAKPKFKSNTNLKFFYFLSPFLVTAAVVGTIGAGKPSLEVVALS